MRAEAPRRKRECGAARERSAYASPSIGKKFCKNFSAAALRAAVPSSLRKAVEGGADHSPTKSPDESADQRKKPRQTFPSGLPQPLFRFRPSIKISREAGGGSHFPFRRIQRSIAFSGSRRKSERESMRMPCSLYHERMGRFTMTILRKASLMESSDACSCCIFSSEGISYADWI